MINGNLSQFLDTGWYNEATLYYHNHVYWCEADTDFASNITRFWVTRWKACMSEDKKLYHTIVGIDQDPLDYETVLDISDSDIDRLKKEFLQAPIFDGKTFWQVEKDIAWLEEGSPISSCDSKLRADPSS